MGCYWWCLIAVAGVDLSPWLLTVDFRDTEMVSAEDEGRVK